jgi:hypothetical protein
MNEMKPNNAIVERVRLAVKKLNEREDMDLMPAATFISKTRGDSFFGARLWPGRRKKGSALQPFESLAPEVASNFPLIRLRNLPPGEVDF